MLTLLHEKMEFPHFFKLILLKFQFLNHHYAKNAKFSYATVAMKQRCYVIYNMLSRIWRSQKLKIQEIL
jgi:hypothetical protein